MSTRVGSASLFHLVLTCLTEDLVLVITEETARCAINQDFEIFLSIETCTLDLKDLASRCITRMEAHIRNRWLDPCCVAVSLLDIAMTTVFKFLPRLSNASKHGFYVDILVSGLVKCSPFDEAGAPSREF